MYDGNRLGAKRRLDIENVGYVVAAFKNQIGHNFCNLRGQSERNLEAAIRDKMIGSIRERAQHRRTCA